MNPFEYASPQTEAEALELMNESAADTAVLAGGTDLVALLKQEVIAPARVVDLKGVASMSGIETDGDGLSIGSLTTLEEMLDSPLLKGYHSLLHVIDATHAIQVQANGTIGGDLCLLPHCWYYRSGYGLLAKENGKSLPEIGDNRYHAILGNRGPAKFVSASRFAPALIAGGAKVRIIGPKAGRAEMVPLEYFYTTPKTAKQGVTILKPGQLISHICIPNRRRTVSATYEVMQMEGLDWPLAAAAACLTVEAGLVTDARIVLGHVAPVPWVAQIAANSLFGKPVTEETAEDAAEIALAEATPLSMNGYKVQIAKTAVKRVLLRATGQPEGGL
ncbi:MAG: FAD binding domain-containing protein [Planctomycetes bacterium]|nr:FAD binding domain-containing protein [Planctomycetota bacterium]